LGDVDSPNLYAFVGWGPHVGTDPLGLNCACGCGSGTPPCSEQPQVLFPTVDNQVGPELVAPFDTGSSGTDLRLTREEEIRIKSRESIGPVPGRRVDSTMGPALNRGFVGDVAHGGLDVYDETLRPLANLAILASWNFGEVATGRQPTTPPFIPDLVYLENELQETTSTAGQMYVAVVSVGLAGPKPVPQTPEKYYRAMSQADFAVFEKTRRLPATSETFISPTRAFSESYEGVLVEFQLRPGTAGALRAVGVRDSSKIVREVYEDLPEVTSGWNQSNAFFKGEGGQVNIGLGRGDALEIFNDNIQGYSVVR